MFKLQLRVKFKKKNGEKKKAIVDVTIILYYRSFFIYIYVYIIDNIYISIGRKYGWMVLGSDRIDCVIARVGKEN